jgi:predicted nucleic acid-binding protein
MNVLVDTNILLRSLQSPHPLQQIAIEAIAQLRTRDYGICLVPQVIYEFWVVATRPIEVNGLGFPPDELHNEIADLKERFIFLNDKPTLFTEWERLVQKFQVRGKAAHDARLVASMITHGLKHLLTFNAADFSRYPGLVTLSPEQLVSSGQ